MNDIPQEGRVRMDLASHLKECIDIEIKTADVYSQLAALFPQARDLFRDLARSEEEHGNLLSMACDLEALCRLPERFQVVSSGSLSTAKSLLAALSSRLEGAGFSGLDEALALALELEDAQAEGYFMEFMEREEELELVRYLKRFYRDEKSHAERIREFMSPT
jgi:rubrerythrin